MVSRFFLLLTCEMRVASEPDFCKETHAHFRRYDLHKDEHVWGDAD